MHHEIIEKVSNVITYVGASSTVVFSFINQYAAALGFVLGCLGYLTNLYYQKKRDRREKIKYERDGILAEEEE